MKSLYAIILFTLGTAPLLFTQERPSENKEVSDEAKRPERKPFPKHWGEPPRIQTKDFRPLPGGFGMGSSTLAVWIEKNIERDVDKGKRPEVKPKPKPKPSLPVRPELPKEIKKKMDNIKRIQTLLKEGLKRKLDVLGEEATKEEIGKTVQEFQKENAGRLEDVRHLSKQIHKWQKENPPARPQRPEPTAEVKEKIKNVREKQKDLEEARHALHEQFKDSKDLSKEDRADLIKKFKEENVGKHKALKEAQKDLAKEVRNRVQTKDRRE